MSNTLCWTDIPVLDLDRAIAFYAGVLDAKIEKQPSLHGKSFGLLPGFDSGVSGCLCEGPQKPSQDGPLIYLSVNGRLEGALLAVAANGGKILEPKHQIGPFGFRAIILDTEGNRLALHSQTA
ncbi:MAG TPA: VOC family protein [Opitutaceae bacterium]|nr:VOC family protein [Opitutaceae bacterium]